jgi:hypothetical protein
VAEEQPTALVPVERRRRSESVPEETLHSPPAGSYRQQMSRSNSQLRDYSSGNDSRTSDSQSLPPYLRSEAKEESKDIPWWQFRTKWKAKDKRRRDRERDKPFY